VETHALTVDCESGLLVRAKIPIEDLKDNEVLVRITHCGVCRSDIKRLRSPRSSSNTLVVPGHEIVGEVVQLGRDVSSLNVGTRVGIGWQSGSCGQCEWCMKNQEHLCADQEETCIERYGGFATHIKVQWRFAIPLPEGLDSAHAAPLLCAGITVFSPMVRHSLRPGQKTAVIGIGGLGHLALQFLRAMGCRPDAFSTSSSKAEDARAFGADAFFCLKDGKAPAQLDSTYDFILSTSPSVSDLSPWIRMLRPQGVLCLAGLPRGETTFSAEELIGFQKAIEGSPIGSVRTIAEMFQFVVANGVRPNIECFPMAGANKAIRRLEENQVRYRVVLIQDLDVYN
jgi:uncharacterized zinc-type alcohol dehydrogenase-like protein